MCKRYAKNFCFAFIMILTYLFTILLHLTTLSSNPTSDCSRRPKTSFEPDLDCCVRSVYSETMSESTAVVAMALPNEDEQEQEGEGEDYIYIST